MDQGRPGTIRTINGVFARAVDGVSLMRPGPLARHGADCPSHGAGLQPRGSRFGVCGYRSSLSATRRSRRDPAVVHDAHRSTPDLAHDVIVKHPLMHKGQPANAARAWRTCSSPVNRLGHPHSFTALQPRPTQVPQFYGASTRESSTLRRAKTALPEPTRQLAPSPKWKE